MSGSGIVRELYELKGDGHSIRRITRALGISRNTVRKYVRSVEVPKPWPKVKRGSKLDLYAEHIDGRLAGSLDNFATRTVPSDELSP